MQRLLRVVALVASTLSFSAAQTNEWGPLVDGLRLSTALDLASSGSVQIRVTVNYIGEKPVLLPFMFVSGERISRHRLRLFVSVADGEHAFSLDDPTIPLRGRFEPLVVPMISHASYILELPISAWRSGFRNQQELETLIRRPGELWAELDCKYMASTAMPPLACPLYGYPNPNAVTCWQGKLISNRLRLGLAR